MQDVFLKHHVTAAMPPFTNGKKQFAKGQVEQAKTISRASIHIERATVLLLYIFYMLFECKPQKHKWKHQLCP